MRGSLAIAGNEVRILLRDPSPVVIIVLMPLAAIAFIAPVYRLLLVSEGYQGASGVEQAVPGMAAMFGFFVSGLVGFAIYREHGWGTWLRLRASPLAPLEIVAGKVATPLAMGLAQQVVLFGAGFLVFGLRVRGPVLGLALLDCAFTASLVAFGFALATLCSSAVQLSVIDRVLSIVFAGIGGALLPIPALPAWVLAVAHATPTYWAMTGFRSVILDGAGPGTVLVPIVVLAGFTVGFLVIALMRFRVDETKSFF